jgi:hypothetical protein
MKRTLRPATRMFCLALLGSFVDTPSKADAAELRIQWTAPAECGSARELRAHVTQLMGGAVQSDVQAVVDVTRDERVYRAHVVLRSPSAYGERQLEAARCDALAESVAVLIALSVPTSKAESRREVSLTLWPRADVLAGALPLTAAGIGGAIAVELLDSLRLELNGAYYFPQSSTFAESTLGANFQLFTLGACICPVWSVGIWQGGPCVGAEVQHVSAVGSGGMTQLPGSTRLQGSTSWWGPTLGLFGRAQLLPALGINIGVEGMVPVSRPTFVFSDVGEPLHHVSAIALQVSLGPEVRF